MKHPDHPPDQSPEVPASRNRPATMPFSRRPTYEERARAYLQDGTRDPDGSEQELGDLGPMGDWLKRLAVSLHTRRANEMLVRGALWAILDAYVHDHDDVEPRVLSACEKYHPLARDPG